MTLEDRVEALVEEAQRLTHILGRRTTEDDEISMETAMILYTSSTKVAVSDNITLFIVDIFGEEKIVKVKLDKKRATVHGNNGNLLSQILNDERKITRFKLIEKEK